MPGFSHGVPHPALGGSRPLPDRMEGSPMGPAPNKRQSYCQDLGWLIPDCPPRATGRGSSSAGSGARQAFCRAGAQEDQRPQRNLLFSLRQVKENSSLSGGPGGWPGVWSFHSRQSPLPGTRADTWSEINRTKRDQSGERQTGGRWGSAGEETKPDQPENQINQPQVA